MLQAELIERVSVLDAELDASALHDFVVENEERPITDVAREVLTLAGWPGAVGCVTARSAEERRGNVILNVVPCGPDRATVSSPPLASTALFAMESPSPLPAPLPHRPDKSDRRPDPAPRPNAGARVRHIEGCGSIGARDANRDRAAGWRELDRVVDQIDERLPQHDAVGDRGWCARGVNGQRLPLFRQHRGARRRPRQAR